MNDLERIALTFYFGTKEYTDLVLSSGREIKLGDYDVVALAREVNQDWAAFDKLAESYFGLLPTLNHTLVTLQVEHVMLKGELFYCGVM